MPWGLYPTYSKKVAIPATNRIPTLEKAVSIFENKRMRVTMHSGYQVQAVKKYLITRSRLYITVRIDENGGLTIEGELTNSFYDFGILPKNINELIHILSNN